MSDFSEFEAGIQTSKRSRSVFSKMFSIAFFVLCAGAIGYLYATSIAYADDGHVYFAPAFLVLLIAAVFLLRSGGALLSGLAVIACVSSMFCIYQKINWQKNYDALQRSGTPFIYHSYIDRYPYWEEYMFPSIMKKPDWIRFTEDCTDPILAGREVGPHCSSLADIRSKYYIDARTIMYSYFRRMQQTAKRIDRKEIETLPQYQVCIDRKRCAEVPLLPDGVRAAAVDRQSEDYLDIRKPFWHLVDKQEITPEVCDFMTLCKVLFTTGAFRFDS